LKRFLGTLRAPISHKIIAVEKSAKTERELFEAALAGSDALLALAFSPQ
jgi:hypothetical protein